jgi:DNA-directed RNA polymerase specialized sigma24 family protein
VRIYRDDQADLWEEPPPVFRDDRLRELVDELPEKQCHVVSRVYFGGAPLKVAAAEIGVSPPTARQLLEDALWSLRDALSQED